MDSLQIRARSFFLKCRARHACPSARRLQQQSRYAPHRPLGTQAVPSNTSKPYYVTTPIFYVNAEPHAGHMYTVVLADVLKRWHVLKGNDRATLLTGTDEHGMKIQKAASNAKVDTKRFCDKHAKQFQELADSANISYDRFIRTTDADHKEVVEAFWRELRQRGWIYEARHEGWYSVSDETFYPDSQVHLVLDPMTGRKMHASIETGKEVEWTSEMNYHFKLSAFKSLLLQHYKENPDFIVPSTRMNFIVKEVETTLTDLSISRPASRLTWGIRVPDDDSQTIYVWLDALINYLTMTGWPYKTPGDADMAWPPDCQVIGKDIVRFHCIYWPAFLMALDLPLPKQFLTHAHWTMGNAKMSKSLGNGVNPFYAMKTYGVDTIRYFMTHDGGIVDDADYDNDYIVEKYKRGLQGGLGNLASRIVRGQKWSVPAAVVQASQQGSFAGLAGDLRAKSEELVKTITFAVDKTDEYMDVPNPRQALRNIMNITYATNKYFHDAQVWELVKDPSAEAQRQVRSIIFTSTEALRISCILLQPFIPAKAAIALDWLGVDPARRTFKDAQFAADLTYGNPLVDPGTAGTKGTLFPPLATDF